ncbi:MAG: plasmid encoded RepA protein [Hyphomicrobiales bacterium]|nr:MAG: plasmid encoded RepA protein [Hyphomicrobiales bacterium]
MGRKKDNNQRELPGFQPVSAALPEAARAAVKRPRRTMRVIQGAVTISEQDRPDIAYQHSVLCQCAMPLRNPGDDVREWERQQGRVSLLLRAGSAMHPEQERLVKVGLPYGPKPRLILAFLNTQAILTDSPVIEVEDSLTRFTDRIGFDKGGRTIRAVKNQLTRLSAADFTFGVAREGRSWTSGGRVVSGFELWFPKDDRQRVLWPTSVELSHEYFASLRQHAVPLNLEALGALKESALALDIYTWLAQRLWRVHPHEAAFITWAALKDQFGPDYGRMADFKRKFRQALRDVHAVYPDARIELDGRGITLRHSQPPIRRRLISTR